MKAGVTPLTRALASRLHLGALVAATLMVACDSNDEPQVPAVNLENGKRSQFAAGELPGGWVPCPNPDCLLDVPCSELGVELCEQTEGCERQVVACADEQDFARALQCGKALDPSGDGSMPPDCASPVDGCEYECVPSNQGESPCAGQCQPTTACPPVDLSAPTSCGSSASVPSYDSTGCLVGFRCIDDCPFVPEPACGGGQSLALTDERTGCTTGFRCEPIVTSNPGDPRTWPGTEGDPTKPPDSSNDSPKCTDLLERYGSALALAQRCSGGSSSPSLETCSETVPTSLACGCPTYVNPANAQALETLRSLRRTWQTLGCDMNVFCAPVSCYTPRGATCAPDPDRQNGLCSDL